MSQSCQEIREARMKGKGTRGESIGERAVDPKPGVLTHGAQRPVVACRLLNVTGLRAFVASESL